MVAAPRKQMVAPTPFAYRIPKAAALLGISPSTLWAKIAKGEIVAHKMGGATVIRHGELQAFVDGLARVEPRAKALGANVATALQTEMPK